jgi:hypothetical protein
MDLVRRQSCWRFRGKLPVREGLNTTQASGNRGLLYFLAVLVVRVFQFTSKHEREVPTPVRPSFVERISVKPFVGGLRPGTYS